MSSEQLSSNMTSNINHALPVRRVAFRHPITTQHTAAIDRTPTPLEAALNQSSAHIATLHPGLTTFLTQLVERCLKEYAEFFYANEKNKEMRLSAAPVPTSVKRIRLTLLPLEEVKESEDYMALHTRLVADTEALHRKWAEEYFKVVDTWNCNARLRRFQLSVCKLIRNAAIAFSAQLGINNNPEDEIVMNFFAASRNDILATPLPLDLSTLIRLYKEANKLSQLPASTIENDTSNINSIIDAINQRINITTTANNVNNSAPTIEPEGEENASTTSSSLTNSTTTAGANTTVNRLEESSLALTITEDTPRTNMRHENVVTPSTLGQSLANTSIATTLTMNSSASSAASSRLYSIPIMHNGRETGYFRPAPAATMMTPTQHPAGDPPSFQCSPIEINDSFVTRLPSSFTQSDNGDLDASLAAIDLEHITSIAVKGNVQMMLHTLFIQTIKIAITNFNACITHRKELNRIKLVTTQIPMESLAAKVTAKIHAERPADRPVLTGLIHDEAEKLISNLKRKLQAVTDQMESNSKKLKELKSTREPRTSSPKQQRQAKNNNGGNLSWSRAQSTSSTAVAEDFSITHRQQACQTTHAPKPQNQKGSHAANNNATAALRRKRNKQRLNNKSRGKDNN